MNTCTDFLGQDVKVGDYVVFPGSTAHLTLGIVQKITDRRVKVLYREKWAASLGGMINSIHKDPACVMKVTCDTVEFRAAKEKLHQALVEAMKRDLS